MSAGPIEPINRCDITMIRLRTLGALDLRNSDGKELRELLAQPKRVALLVYLAISRPDTLHRRDTLLALFWPESDTVRARASLSQALSFLRHALGPNILIARGSEEIGLDATLLWCDVRAFDEAIAAGRLAEALDYYRDDLLIGFHASASPGFDEWLDRERARLLDRARRIAWTLAEREAKAGDCAASSQWARRALSFPPDSESDVRRFLKSLDALGDRAGALHIYALFAERLRSACGMEPSAETLALVAAIRERKGHANVQVPDRSDDAPAQADVVRVIHAEGLVPGSSEPGFASRGRPHAVSRVALGVTALSMVVAMTVFGFSRVWTATSATAAEVRSIAVLPVEDLSAVDREPYLADGLTAGMIAELSRVGLFQKIPSRSSVMRYKGTTKSTRDIARELDVDAVLETSMQRSNGRVRITAKLTHGETGANLWAAVHERDLSEVFSLQNELAIMMTRALRVPRAPGASRVSNARRPMNLAAQDVYLRGIYALARGRSLEAIPLLRRAVSLDPGFATAHARLAEAYQLVTYFASPETPPAPESLEAASAAAKKALALDASDPYAHYVLARIQFLLNLNVKAGEAEVRRALDLDPMLADAQLLYGQILAATGRYHESIAAMERARALDPADYGAHAGVGFAYLAAGRFDDARRDALKLIALDSMRPNGYFQLAQSYVQQGKFDEGIVAYRKGLALQREPNHIHLGLLGNAYGRAGRHAEARQILDQLVLRYQAKRAAPYSIALTYVGLGQRDSALTWLETGYGERWGSLIFLRANAAWKPLHAEPRYLALLSKLALQ